MILQKSFGEFTTERFGSNWVYGRSKTQESFARNGVRQTVITRKEQRQLAADYKAKWGREYDAAGWAMICALRAIRVETRRADVRKLAIDALKVAGVSP